MIPNRTAEDQIPDPSEVKSDAGKFSERDKEILADRPPHHG